jgi:hypothetical protein
VRRLVAPLGAVTVLAVVAEPLLGIHGHWPPGASAALGIAGGLALAFGAKALGETGLQGPDPEPPAGVGGAA